MLRFKTESISLPSKRRGRFADACKRRNETRQQFTMLLVSTISVLE